MKSRAIAYARALFGGGNPAIVQQYEQTAAELTPTQIAPASRAFPWPMRVLGQQLLNPVLPGTGGEAPPVGRWGGNQYLGPAMVPMPASSPAYTAAYGIRNLYGPGFANVPKQSPTPSVSIAPAGAPNIVTTKAALDPALVRYINQS